MPVHVRGEPNVAIDGLRHESDTTYAAWFVMRYFCRLLQFSGVRV